MELLAHNDKAPRAFQFQSFKLNSLTEEMADSLPLRDLIKPALEIQF